MSKTAEAYYQFEEVNLSVVECLKQELADPQAPLGKSVLDLGCGRARLGQELEKLGFRVTGVESNPVAVAVAKDRISELVEMDLLNFEAMENALAGKTFDWIIASDVLEHLPYPQEALKFYQRFLAPQGKFVCSVPNIALWDVRIRLLFGYFDYTDSGVMDRTHLRLFTIRTATGLFKDAGFKILALTYDPGIVRAFLPIIKHVMVGKKGGDPSAIVDSGAYRLYTRFVLPIEQRICHLLPGLFAFRIVIVAEPGAIGS